MGIVHPKTKKLYIVLTSLCSQKKVSVSGVRENGTSKKMKAYDCKQTSMEAEQKTVKKGSIFFGTIESLET